MPEPSAMVSTGPAPLNSFFLATALEISDMGKSSWGVLVGVLLEQMMALVFK